MVSSMAESRGLSHVTRILFLLFFFLIVLFCLVSFILGLLALKWEEG